MINQQNLEVKKNHQKQADIEAKKLEEHIKNQKKKAKLDKLTY